MPCKHWPPSPARDSQQVRWPCSLGLPGAQSIGSMKPRKAELSNRNASTGKGVSPELPEGLRQRSAGGFQSCGHSMGASEPVAAGNHGGPEAAWLACGRKTTLPKAFNVRDGVQLPTANDSHGHVQAASERKYLGVLGMEPTYEHPFAWGSPRTCSRLVIEPKDYS